MQLVLADPHRAIATCEPINVRVLGFSGYPRTYYEVAQTRALGEWVVLVTGRLDHKDFGKMNNSALDDASDDSLGNQFSLGMM